MNQSEIAMQAIATLKSLPNWDRISEFYFCNLAGIEDALQSLDWDDLNPTDEELENQQNLLDEL